MIDTSRPMPARRSEQAARDRRLARALRENLRRRKEQVRAREPRPGKAAGERQSGGKPPA